MYSFRLVDSSRSSGGGGRCQRHTHKKDGPREKGVSRHHLREFYCCCCCSCIDRIGVDGDENDFDSDGIYLVYIVYPRSFVCSCVYQHTVVYLYW